MSESTTTVDQRWVAIGETGAVGTIHRIGDEFKMRLLADSDYRGTYPSLEVAKSALHAALTPGSEMPEFREH